jgi:transglutaminase-like putative cysteine protease
MNRKILALVVVVALVAVSAMYLQGSQNTGSPLPTTPGPGQSPLTFYVYENTIFRIDAQGNAEVEWVMEMPASAFTDHNILSILGGNIGSATVHGIGVENAKSMYISSLQGSYANYGWEMDGVSCDMPSLAMGNSFRINIMWTASHLAYRQDNEWRIPLQPVDLEGYARYTLNSIKNVQANLSVMVKATSSNCQLIQISATFYVLPQGAEIANASDLQVLEERTDLGGGSMVTANTHVSEIDGAPAVVLDSQIQIASPLITIDEQGFLASYKFIPIGYTGVAPPHDFESSATWATLDMKFGRQRDAYTVSIDGVEEELSPYQLLYYSAKEVVILAGGGSEPLLTAIQPIAVAPPDSESGDWGTFLKTLSTSDLVALARDIRDKIDDAGKVPSAIVSPIGNLRFRDALFTFLRVISFYHEHGKLPDNLEFVPAPTGNLMQSGAEIPAAYAYFTLGEQYVVTGTPRVNQILSDLRQPNFSESRFAENLCGWVYEKITYPVPLILGWFTSEEVLDMMIGECGDKANLYMALTRTAGMPTRRITGFLINDKVNPPFLDIAGITPDGKYIVSHAWTEVYIPENGWVFADPTAGHYNMNRYDIGVYSSLAETWQQVLVNYETTYGKLIG